MENSIKALDRDLIIKAIKTLLYFIPIIGITNKIYTHYYGEYKVKFNLFIEFAENHMDRLVIAFLIFSLLFGVSMILERFIIPLLAILLLKPYIIPDEAKVDSDKRHSKLFGEKRKKLFSKKKRFLMNVDLAFLYITVSLWMIYFNRSTYYVILCIWTVFMFIVIKSMNSYFDQPSKKKSNPKDSHSNNDLNDKVAPEGL